MAADCKVQLPSATTTNNSVYVAIHYNCLCKKYKYKFAFASY